MKVIAWKIISLAGQDDIEFLILIMNLQSSLIILLDSSRSSIDLFNFICDWMSEKTPKGKYKIFNYFTQLKLVQHCKSVVSK